jgi:manganese-dependent inorganic pyrophosphatase
MIGFNITSCLQNRQKYSNMNNFNKVQQVPFKNHAIPLNPLHLTKAHLIYFTSAASLKTPTPKLVVVGHKNPDTDSIDTAIAEAYLKQQLLGNSRKVIAARAGELNAESKFVLSKLKQLYSTDPDFFKIPKLVSVDSLKPENTEILMVDHNDEAQRSSFINPKKIVGVIDHHNIGSMKTDKAIEVRTEAVGCTATIVAGMYEENKIKMPAPIAFLLLAAIISDTDLLTSDTTTQKDLTAVNKLTKIAKIGNWYNLGNEMLNKGDNYQKLTLKQIVNKDFKVYTGKGTEGKALGVGQILLASPVENLIKKRKNIVAELNLKEQSEGINPAILAITDRINKLTYLIHTASSKELLDKAFNHVKGSKRIDDNTLYLPDISSRKLNICPAIMDALEGEEVKEILTPKKSVLNFC